MTDIINEIDALIDEQLEAGEPENGWDYSDPTYPKCPHCQRHWHGLRLTRRIVSMYNTGVYDPDYSYADDDSEILCEGSEFIGPVRPPKQWDSAYSSWQTIIGGGLSGTRPELPNRRIVSVQIHRPSPFGHMRALLEEMTESIQRDMRRIADLSISFPVYPQWEMSTGSWTVTHTLKKSPWWKCTPHPEIKLGPENWHHEIVCHSLHQLHHWGYLDIHHTVQHRWNEFTAPDFPVPEKIPYDFEKFNLDGNSGPQRNIREMHTTGGRL